MHPHPLTTAKDWLQRHRAAALLLKGGSLLFLLKGLAWIAVVVAAWLVLD